MSILNKLNQDLRAVKRVRRRHSRLLKSIGIRQAARKGFDLPRFGQDALERMLVGLIFSTLFFFIFLGVSRPLGLTTQQGLFTAGFALLVAFGTCAMLVLWGSDTDLELARTKATQELMDARSRESELEEQIEDEEDKQADRDDERAEHDDERRARHRGRQVRCPFCRDMIRADSLKCRHCGEILDPRLRSERDRKWNPGVAALLSFLIAGTGQMYKGDVAAGLIWFFGLVMLYAVSLPLLLCGVGFIGLFAGVVLHIVCIFDAAAG